MSALIGIMGGMFDPPHIGHIHTALSIKQQLNFAEVRLVPCRTAPHRGPAIASEQQRLDMLSLALAGEAGLLVDDREFHRSGSSYTVDTLNSLREEHPHSQLFLIVGMDGFISLPSWHCWQQLFELAHLLVITRPGWQLTESAVMQDELAHRRLHNVNEFKQFSSGKILLQSFVPLELSSSQIRELIIQHKSVRYLLPEAVLNYVIEKQLYL